MGQTKILNGITYNGTYAPPAWDDYDRMRWADAVTVQDAVNILLAGLRATIGEDSQGRVTLIPLSAAAQTTDLILNGNYDTSNWSETLGISNMVAGVDVQYKFNPAQKYSQPLRTIR